MKKIRGLLLVAVALFVVGCSNTSQPAKKGSTPASSSQSSTASSKKGEMTATSKITKRFLEINRQITDNYHVDYLPTNVNVGQDKVINADFSGDQDNYQILYSLGQTKQTLGTKKFATSSTFSTYQLISLASKTDALAKIDWQDTQKGLPEVDLGHEIKGTQEGAAGSKYTHWNEGRWSITLRTSNADGPDALPVAKKMVNYFENYALPAPSDRGSIDVNLTDNTLNHIKISWNEDRRLYSFTGSDIFQTLSLAQSLNG